MAVTKGYVLAAGQSLHRYGNDSGTGTKASASSTGGSLILIESTLTGALRRHVHELIYRPTLRV